MEELHLALLKKIEKIGKQHEKNHSFYPNYREKIGERKDEKCGRLVNHNELLLYLQEQI